MSQHSDFWSAWMAGWVNATKTLLEAQQRALQMLMPHQSAPLEPAQPATAADKPQVAPPRRDRLPKSAAQPTPRRRGRPPKAKRTRS